MLNFAQSRVAGVLGSRGNENRGFRPHAWNMAWLPGFALVFLCSAPAGAVTPSFRLGYSQGASLSEQGPAAFTMSMPEGLFRLQFNEQQWRYRAGVSAALRYDSGAWFDGKAGQEWFLDAALRPLELQYELFENGVLGGLGPFFAVDVGLRTEFERTRLFLRPELGLSVDGLLEFGVRYAWFPEVQGHNLETFLATDPLKLMSLFLPRSDDENFK